MSIDAVPFFRADQMAGERNTGSQLNSYQVGLRGDWNITRVTGSTSNVVTAVPAHVHCVRNAMGTATAGTVTMKNASTSVEVIAASLASGAQRDYYGGRFDAGITVDLSNTADVVLVFWRPI